MPPRRTPTEQAIEKFEKHVQRLADRLARMDKAHEGRKAPLLAELQKYHELLNQMEGKRSEA